MQRRIVEEVVRSCALFAFCGYEVSHACENHLYVVTKLNLQNPGAKLKY